MRFTGPLGQLHRVSLRLPQPPQEQKEEQQQQSSRRQHTESDQGCVACAKLRCLRLWQDVRLVRHLVAPSTVAPRHQWMNTSASVPYNKKAKSLILEA